MNRNEFIARLKENGIPQGIVSFDSSTNDGYNIRKNKLRWEMFTIEKGKSMIALDFLRKAMHCSICLMNSSLYMQGISQILKGFRSTPDKSRGITTAMLAGT